MKTPFFLIALLSCVTFLSCSPKIQKMVEHHQKWYEIKSASDTELTAFLKPYKVAVDTQMKVVIGHTDMPLTKAQPESTIGNFMADALLEKAQKIDEKVVGAITNYGGIRIPYIAPGAITKGKIYELMPFDNMVCIVEMSGEILQKFCDDIALKKGWPIAGIRFKIKNKSAVEIMIGNQSLDNSRVYKIALNDYTARGGDNCDFLIPLKKRFTNIFVRDCLIETLDNFEKKHLFLHPLLDNRISYVE